MAKNIAECGGPGECSHYAVDRRKQLLKYGGNAAEAAELLSAACSDQTTAGLRGYLEHGGNKNAHVDCSTSGEAMPMLSYYCEEGMKEHAMMLIEAQADVDAGFQTPLQTAAQ